MDEFLIWFNSRTPYLYEIIIAGLLFFFIEKIRPAEKKTPFFKDDTKTEALLAVINILIFIPLISMATPFLLVYSVGYYFEYRMFSDEIEMLPLALQIILGALILDFSTYWRHRFTHFYMWSYHSIHHSAQQINWLTSMRMHPGDLVIATIIDSFILFFLGFSGTGFVGAMILVRAMNYFTHLNLDIKFSKPLRYIIASPHYHRWHHATKMAAYNTNFCGAFPFLDILFGTYYHPEELPEAYGLSKGEQKKFPKTNYFGWLVYPFKRDIKIWKKKLGYGNNDK